MKNLIRVVPLAVFIILLLAIKLSGCQILPDLPTTGTGTAGGTTTGSAATSHPITESGTGSSASGNTETTATTTTMTESVTPAPTPTAAPSGSGTGTTAAPTPTTAKPTPTAAKPTPTAGIDPSKLSNTKLGWWYNYPTGSLYQDKPATISASIRQLISHYDVVWQYPLTGRKIVYLTMDEGYEFEDNTTEILNTAKIKGVPITFFITGSYIRNNPAKVTRMVDEGHLVANHTMNHPNLVDLVAAKGESGLLGELRGLENAFRTLTGESLAKIVRPPEGSYSERVLAYLTRNRYRTAFWSFAYKDWLTAEQPDPATAKAKILGQLHNGSVILLHAVSDTNVAILPDLIDEIRARGYDFALIDEIP